MRFIAFPLALAPFALAACQQAEPDPQPAETAAGTSPVKPDGTPAAPPPATPATATAIPERFRGVWDYAEGNCMPSSDLRMDIGAGSIEFYESLGTVTGVTIESPDSIVVDLAMEGEGERWTVQNRLVLSDNGQRLTPADTRADNEQLMPRKRCAAA